MPKEDFYYVKFIVGGSTLHQTLLNLELAKALNFEIHAIPEGALTHLLPGPPPSSQSRSAMALPAPSKSSASKSSAPYVTVADRILAMIADKNRPMGAAELHQHMRDVTRPTVATALHLLHRAKKIARVERGMYGPLPPEQPASSGTEATASSAGDDWTANLDPNMSSSDLVLFLLGTGPRSRGDLRVAFDKLGRSVKHLDAAIHRLRNRNLVVSPDKGVYAIDESVFVKRETRTGGPTT